MERVLDLDVQVKGNNNTNDSMGDERVTSHFYVALVVKRRVVLTASVVRVLQVEPERALFVYLIILSAKTETVY